MAERALRGARLGAQSFEDERGVEMAPRQEIEYVCPDGHTFAVTMADEAEVPD
ncbi:MAG: RNA polymerase-binding protein RbpA, partial [Aeromicrobium sp.]